MLYPFEYFIKNRCIITLFHNFENEKIDDITTLPKKIEKIL